MVDDHRGNPQKPIGLPLSHGTYPMIINPGLINPGLTKISTGHSGSNMVHGNGYNLANDQW